MGQAIFSLAGELCNCTLVHITDVLNQRAAELYDVATIFIPAHIRHFLLLTLYPIRRILSTQRQVHRHVHHRIGPSSYQPLQASSLIGNSEVYRLLYRN